MTWHDGLSPEQRECAQHIGAHSRLLAGPGTGKTRTLTARIAYLMEEQEMSLGDILAITFTRAATTELRNRVSQILGEDELHPQVVTLHSYALSTILRNGAGHRLPTPIRIADDYEERKIIQEDLKHQLNLRTIDEVQILIKQLSADWETLAADVDGWRKRFPSPSFLGAWEEHRMIYGYTLRSELVYQLKLALEEGEISLTKCPSYILIDEYQDLNSCDLAVVKCFAKEGAELYVAGDDDQSIYGFRYANPEGIRRFLVEYPGSVELSLTECRRCAESILDIAVYVAQQDVHRIEKQLSPNGSIGGGEVHLLRYSNYTYEAKGIASISKWLIEQKGIPNDQILVLLRSDARQKFSKPLLEAFRNEGLAATTVEKDKSLLDNPEGRYFLSLLRLINNPADNLAWRTILTLRINNLGEQAFTHIYEIARLSGVTFYEALKLIDKDPSLVERQGHIIKKEFGYLNQTLSRINSATEEFEELLELIDWLFNEILDGKQWDEIKQFIYDNIKNNEIDDLDSLLNILIIPVEEEGLIKTAGNINIMTMHQAKGLDASAVFIVAAEDEYIPGRANRADDIDDERRLLYVSITRARSYLYITHCRRRTGEQCHSGSTSGDTSRHLTRFLRGGPLLSQVGSEYLAQINT